jgi:hypothetical protein
MQWIRCQRPGESREADRQSLPLLGSQRPKQLLMVGVEVLADAVSNS